MTNETNRMKTKVGRIGSRGMGTRTLAIVLCFVMLLTAIGSGSVLSAIAVEGNGASVLLDAAKAGASVDVAADVASADEEASDKAVDDGTSEPNYEVVPEDDVDDVLKLNKKADADIAETGDANVYAVAGSWDGWQKHYFSGSTGSATVSISLAANTSYTFKIYSNYGSTAWYGADNTFTATTSEYYFNTSKGNATLTTTYGNNYTFTLKREDQNDGSVAVGITYPTSGSSGTTAPGLWIYGNINGATNWTASTGGKALTYVGSSGGYYYYYYSFNANQQHNFRFSDNQGSSYNPQNNSADVVVSNNSTSMSGTWKNGSDGSQNKSLQLNNTAFRKILWVKYSEHSSVSCWYSTEYYALSGYLDGGDVTDEVSANRFTYSSGTTYTLTKSFTTSTQYVTVRDGNGNAFHPAVHGSGSGVKAAPQNSDRSPGNDNKWLVTGVAGKQVRFTWNVATGALSWTVLGNSVTVYAKDGAAPINWDNDNTSNHTALKEGAGATGLSGLSIDGSTKYYYNYAAIAKTSMTYGDGTAISGKTTTVCDINNASAYNYDSEFETATVEAGKSIKITTVITNYNGWRSKYYVKGWSINGVTYKAGTNVKGVNTVSDGSSGSYTMTYTVPANSAAGAKIEITPIYYLQSNSNSVTFYLEGYDTALQNAGWGHTPYAYPFYGNLSGYQNSFGAYPGQPMVYVDGKYSMEVPITSTAIYSSTNNGTIIKGVTVNNGYADHVHRNLVYDWNTKSGDIGNDETHRQTYDFDDFYKIYNEKRDSNGNKPNAIILRIKRETTRDNRNIYGDAYNYGTNGYNSYINWGYSKNDPYTSLNGSNVTTNSQYVKNIAQSGNGWELLTDRYGRPVDLFGNVISTTYSASAETAKPAIRVVSTGYNENMAGDYATGWLIYTPDSASGYTTEITNADGTSAGYIGANYTLQTASGGTATRKAVPPSVFLLASSSSFNTTTYPNVTNRQFDGVTYSDTINNYKNLYNTLNTSGTAGTNAIGRYVYITYESDQQRKGKTNSSSDTAAYGAKRLDARWYYTYATDMVNANIKVQVYNTSTNKFQDVAFKTTNSGYNSKNNNTVSSTVSGKSTNDLKAYFTNAAFDGEVESGDVLINSGNFEFKAVSNGNWVFDSWQIEYDGGVYTELSDSAVASTPMSATDTLVARFRPLTTGNLALSHHLSSDSTGSGTTQINVQVFSNSSKTDLLYESGLSTDDVTLDGSYISNALSSLYIYVTLTTTPSGDDKINQMTGPSTKFFGGTSPKSITDTNSPYSYSFGFTVGDLYSSGTQNTLSLAYTSRIIIQNHYYTFVYTYPKRGSANTATDGSYKVEGTFTAKEYETYVSGDHVLSGAFVKAKAPYESNFNKNMTLNYNNSYTKASTYNTSSYRFTVNVSYSQTDSTDYYAIFDLPYDYYTAASTVDGVKVKKFTAKPNSSGKILTTDDAETIEIDTVYGNFLTSADGCAQTKVSKVADDSGDPNHTGNDFITAPEEMYSSDGNTKLYFNYWQIMTADRSLELNRVYYLDFNYRLYGNYYIKPVYTDDPEECWRLKTQFENDFSASIMYLDTTRNQWNSSTSQSNVNNTTIAADRLYNDFLVAYGFNGEEIKNNSKVSEVGIIFEIVPTAKGGSTFALGDASSASTAVYKTQYDSTKPDESVLKNFVNGTTPSTGKYLKAVLDKNGSNTKNRIEYDHTFYAQYGQNGYDFLTDPKTDDYVFRAYSYIKDSTGKIAISTPVYFSMAYTANRKG